VTDLAPPIESILVVDDSTVQRHFTLGLARELGIADLREAVDGADALRLLRGGATLPALMIIDLEMPAMDGIELIQKMREHQLCVPFVVASSREGSLVSAVEEMARVLGLPVLAGVRKPLTKELLVSAFAACRNFEAPSLPVPPKDSLPLEDEELSDAIARHAIVPHYQPKVDLRTGLLRGVEALARWPHPKHGFVPPDQFISVAERQGHGAIHAVTLNIVDQAMAQAARWNARGLRLSLAVNLSPLLLDAPDLVEELCSLLETHQLTADQVVLEITESSLPRVPGVALGVLARLRMKGFGLAIDDYGTGFSSMQQLSRVPFTELKIDRSFVHHAHCHENRRVILESALEMAHRLKLVTVAEGVETIEDWRLLQQFGCDIGQGYLVAKPMPAAALPSWLKGHRKRLTELRACTQQTTALNIDGEIA
jgi:EAL domain-containing protein (putative c-di-GMP-specific phosphodiesterase class I)